MNYFFGFRVVEEIYILLLGDWVNLGLIVNCVISTFTFNEVAQIFCCCFFEIFTDLVLIIIVIYRKK